MKRLSEHNQASRVCFILCLVLLLFALSADANDATSPVFVGGLFSTIGAPENLHSLAQFSPETNDWSNVQNSAVLSTGTAEAISLVTSRTNEHLGVVVGGIFDYMNHTSDQVSFGNIAFFNASQANWIPLGFGCNGPITSLSVVSLPETRVLDNTTVDHYNVLVAGRFSSCYQNASERTAVSFPEGLGFYDLTAGLWYRPMNQSLAPPDTGHWTVTSITTSEDWMYLAADPWNAQLKSSVGELYRSPLRGGDDGQILSLAWELLVTANRTDNVFSTVAPGLNGTFYLGGYFTTLYSSTTVLAANNIVYFDGTEFSALDSGLNGRVVSCALSGNGTLYAAGNFTSASGVAANHVASWDGTAWAPLGGGVTINTKYYRSVTQAPELQVGCYGEIVVVGGAISAAGSMNVSNIALWNGTTWGRVNDESYFTRFRMMPFVVSPSGSLYLAAQGLENTFFEDIVVNGYPLVENLIAVYDIEQGVWPRYLYNELLLDGVVLAMKHYNESSLLIAGGFRKVGNITNLNNVVLVSSDGTYESFDGGIYGLVTCLALADDVIYMGGAFQFTDEEEQRVSSITSYSFKTGWSNLAEGIVQGDPERPERPVVHTIAVSASSDILYVGGSFIINATDDQGHTQQVSSLVGWSIEDNQWFPLQTNLLGTIRCLAVQGSDRLYVGGNYTIFNTNATMRNFASLNVSTVSSVTDWLDITPTCNPSFGECESQCIWSVAIYEGLTPEDDIIFIGGQIDTIQNNVMNGLSQLVNGHWVAFGDGLSPTKKRRTATVFALGLTGDSTILYIGGSFSAANSVAVNDFVSWSLAEEQFIALPSVPYWSGVVLAILPTSEPTQSESMPDDSLSLGIIAVLAVVILLLLFILITIAVVLVRDQSEKEKRKRVDLENDTLTAAEKETWEDFYSYEWEVSYNLLEISEPAVGRGRNGVVHSAMYKGQTVAVKIFNADIAGAYYLKENVCKYSSLLRQMKHPNIVHLVGACTDPLCLVMEYGPLGSLTDIIRINPSRLTWMRIKTLMLEVARGMCFLHGQQPALTHQNLSSNNIIVNEYWSARIADAGLSSILTESGEYKLSYPKRWSAPEVLLGRRFTTKSDVFSYGMILYHVMTGITPMSIEEKEASVSVSQLIIRGVRPLVPVHLIIPSELRELMEQCWQEDSTKRPSFPEIVTILNNIPDTHLPDAKS